MYADRFANPIRALEASQPARSFLQVRLDEIGGVVKLQVSPLPLADLVDQEVADRKVGPERLVEKLEGRWGTRNQASVEHGGQGLAVEAGGVVDQVVRIGDVQLDPRPEGGVQEPIKLLDRGVEFGTCVVARDEGEIDVGKWGKLSPAVSTDRDDGEGG